VVVVLPSSARAEEVCRRGTCPGLAPAMPCRAGEVACPPGGEDPPWRGRRASEVTCSPRAVRPCAAPSIVRVTDIRMKKRSFFLFSLEHVGPRCRRDDGKSGAVNTLPDPRSTVELLRGGAMRISSSGAVFQSWSSIKHTSTSMRDSRNSRSNIRAYKRTEREGSRQASYYIIPPSNNLDAAVQC
jgi:hypothetical protein